MTACAAILVSPSCRRRSPICAWRRTSLLAALTVLVCLDLRHNSLTALASWTLASAQVRTGTGIFWHDMLDRWRRVSKLSWPLTPHLVAFGRPPRHAISNVTRALLPQWDRLHAATVQAIWNLRCQTMMDGAPKPSVPALVAASLSLTVPA